MSSGQKPRRPEFFPRMKHRGWRRHGPHLKNGRWHWFLPRAYGVHVESREGLITITVKSGFRHV